MIASAYMYPHEWTAWLNTGHLCRTLGALDEAATAYRRAISLHSGGGAAWWGIANLKQARLDAADRAAMRSALVSAPADTDRVALHFALGAALDTADDAPSAFAEWKAGNALRRARVRYDAASTSAGFRRAEAVLSSAGVIPSSTGTRSTASPIFIVGLPRSGSTLIEQILASHPAIEGLGELPHLNVAARPLASADGYLDKLADMTSAALRAIGEAYLAATLPHRSHDHIRFTDKMPANWIYAGVIPLILPGARIIDVRRHPMACGFANYTQLYAAGNDWAYDLADIGAFYADYVRHMTYIDRVAPGTVHRVLYEDLVADPEGVIRRLLDHLDLPYDAACLRFHENRRPVDSPSSAQVRRPIERGRMDRWRAYAAWLAPLEHALGPVLTSYPAPPAGW